MSRLPAPRPDFAGDDFPTDWLVTGTETKGPACYHPIDVFGADPDRTFCGLVADHSLSSVSVETVVFAARNRPELVKLCGNCRRVATARARTVGL